MLQDGSTESLPRWLMAPLHSGCQEPGQSQNDPPNGGGHAEEVHHHEENCTPFFLSSLRSYWHHFWRVYESVARCSLFVQRKSNDISKSNHEVTSRQEYDWTLRVAKSGHVNEKSQYGEKRGS